MEGLADRLTSGESSICVVGLGYVGLPLAAVLSGHFSVVGFDISKKRVQELTDGIDSTCEISSERLRKASITFSNDPMVIGKCSVIIVTVPTPVNAYKIPDLSPVLSATRNVGKHMSRGSVIVFESTVYPGVTEDECIPILQRDSGLTHLHDFHVGYSPERVNPGDREHTIDKIVKVVSGDTPETCDLLANIYGKVITAGVHRAPSIRTAEAAKVIENTQRDLNIALMNELALIFNMMGIDTREVLKAAATKWNFLNFEPGLVGGHCIGVDPYYLTFKAESLGYRPEVILAGRRINDTMGKFIAEKTVKLLIRVGKAVHGSRVLIMGLTFKENITDIRNTRVIDIVKELNEYGTKVTVWDPCADETEVRKQYNLELSEALFSDTPYDAVIVAVKHREFIQKWTPQKLADACCGNNPILIDVKGLFDPEESEKANFTYWRL
jgi:UDP-N-acetyl-D-glucosamine/UDP-N-acetyl-D-galactosamine dehydrogenase